MIVHKKCYYCERTFGQQCGIETRDHVIPRVLGGTTEPANIVICCGECNVNKGDKLLWEWESRLVSKYGARMHSNPEWRERIDIILANVRRHHFYVQPYKDVGKHDF